MVRPRARSRLGGEPGQALPLVLGVLAAVLVGVLVLAAFGQALGGRSRQQRGADLAAVSAARSMRADYPRLFEPPVLPNGRPNPRHLSTAAYLARARAAAVDGGRRNGVRVGPLDVGFPGGGFAPTRVRVRAGGSVRVRVDGTDRRRRRRVPVEASAVAEIAPAIGGTGEPADASGGGYDGPLAYRQGKPMRCVYSAVEPWRRSRSSRRCGEEFIHVVQAPRPSPPRCIRVPPYPRPAPPSPGCRGCLAELGMPRGRSST